MKENKILRLTGRIAASVGIAAVPFVTASCGNATINAERVFIEGAPKTSAAAGTPRPTDKITVTMPETGNFLTGIPVPEGTTLAAGKQAIVREIDWNTNEVWIWWTHNLDHSIKIGKGVIHDDGNKLQVRDAWTGEGPWTSEAQEAWQEAQNIRQGSLGRTGMNIHFMQANGGFGSVPNDVSQYSR